MNDEQDPETSAVSASGQVPDAPADRDRSDDSGGDEQSRELRTHSHFAAMVASYSLGTFNENFFKEAAMLMAVSAGRGYLQGYATIIFSIPYILIAAPAGWLADRFSRRQVMVGCKLFEVVAMTVGAVGLYYENWTLIIIMAGAMATQSALFSPSLNGTIPQLYRPDHVNSANAVVKVVAMSTILAGAGFAGVALDIKQLLPWAPLGGHGVVLLVAISVTVVGFAVSLGIPRFPAADPQAKFPWLGPLISIRNLWRARRDRLLAITLGAGAFIWAMGSIMIMVINEMGIREFHLSQAMTGGMVVVMVVGFGFGGLLSSILCRGKRWYRALPPAAVVMGLCMCLAWPMTLLPQSIRPWGLGAVLLATGAGGGMLMIPCESFIQIRPEPEHKGAVIAAANFADFAGVMMTGPLAIFLNGLLRPTTSFAILGGVNIAAAAFFYTLLRSDKVQP